MDTRTPEEVLTATRPEWAGPVKAGAAGLSRGSGFESQAAHADGVQRLRGLSSGFDHLCSQSIHSGSLKPPNSWIAPYMCCTTGVLRSTRRCPQP